MGGILNWAFRDVFLLMIAILILLVNPIEEPTQDAEQIAAQGQLIFEISWGSKVDADIDLWVKPPGQPYVSYQNKGGRSCNLLRDDVGLLGGGDWEDLSNQEIMVCRNPTADLEWVANAHYYSAFVGSENRILPVKVFYRVLMHDGNAIVVKDEGSFALNAQGEEHTMVRFKMTEGGDIYGKNYEYQSLFVQMNHNGTPRGRAGGFGR